MCCRGVCTDFSNPFASLWGQKPGLQVVTGQLAYTKLSFSAPPNLQPFFPNGFHKQLLRIGTSGKTSPPSVSKKVPSQHIPWPVPWFPALLRKSGPQQSCSGVTSLPVGHRTDEQVSRENRIGKGINMYTCWKWHSAAAQGLLL